MKIKIAIMCSTLVFSSPLLAGSLDSPAAPTDAGSAMYKLDDIYNRLNNGTTGTKRTGAFVEPTNGPTAGTGHTLDEIMGKAPVINANGATPAQVLQGTFFWGLLGGTWGLQPGTATAGDNVSGNSLSMTIPDGFYSGNKTATTSDADLTAANIKSGVEIFGVAGNVVEATGDATVADVLIGKTFSNAGNAGVSGSMPNNAAVTIIPSTTAQTIAAGYHNGAGTVAGDADLTAVNIKSNVNIFGVAGSVIEATGDATAANVLTGNTFSNAGNAGVSGSMADNAAVTITPSATQQTIAAGYHNGSGTVEGDANLTAENIKKNVVVFGVTGTYEAGATCSGSLDGTRWCDNGNGTVTDMTTGLVWLKKADWGGQKQWDGNSNDNAHVQAGILVNGETDADLSDGSEEGDWRLPTKSELVGITIGDEAVSSGNMRAFSGVQAVGYWSSSPFVYNTAAAWYVSLNYGGVSGSFKTNTLYVWPVRGGQ